MKFLRLEDVMKLTALGRTTIYVKMTEGDFPKPVSIGERRVAWVADEIDTWQKARVAARDTRETASATP